MVCLYILTIYFEWGVGSYPQVPSQNFWPMIIIQPSYKISWNFYMLYSWSNSTSYQNIIKFYSGDCLLSRVKKPWYGVWGMILHNMIFRVYTQYGVGRCSWPKCLFREFSNERTRVERKEEFKKMRMKENFYRAIEGYFNWIVSAGWRPQITYCF